MDTSIPLVLLSCALALQVSLSFSTDIAADSSTDCGNLTCSHNSRCRNETEPYTCQCHSGFKGETCDEDRDECITGNPCYHRGICHNTIGSWWCECLDGWNGTEHCEDNITEVRLCMPGWAGDWCDAQCYKDSDCGVNANCHTLHNGKQVCSCNHGWGGKDRKTCSEDTDECISRHPCRNSGSCINNPGSYFCGCTDGYTGINCENDVDECAIQKCVHVDNCTNMIGSYSCNCTYGWQGDDCNDDVNECESNPCNGTALTCQNIQGSYACVQPSTGNPSTSNVGIIAGASVGAFLAILAALLGLLYKFKWKRNPKNSVSDLKEETEVGNKHFQPHKNGITA